MKDIKCPHCEKVFRVDEAGFADILKQVRDHQFEKELHERLEIAEREKNSAVELAQSKIENALQKELAKKDQELAELKAEKDRDFAAQLAKKKLNWLKLSQNLKKQKLNRNWPS